MHFLLDIGGTKTRIATSLNLQTIDDLTIIPTNKTYTEELVLLKDHIDKNFSETKIDSATIGIAGIYNEDKGVLENAPNLKDWIDKPILSDLRKVFKTYNITIKNDAALAALAEAQSVNIDMGKDEIVAYITIGTGVGGARVVNGVLDESTFGFEPGHQIINFNGEKSETLEEYVSGSGIKRRYGIDLSDKSLEVSENLINSISKHLAIGLHNVSLLWSPDVIIIGGGLGISDLINLENVQMYFNEIFKISSRKPLITKASLGDLSGIQGARMLANETFNNLVS